MSEPKDPMEELLAIDEEAPESEDPELDALAEVQADADEDGIDPEADPDAEDDEEDGEPDEPAIEPPQFLDEKEREVFAALPRDAQEIVLKHDKALVADYTRKTQAVAEERKIVQAQRQQLEQVISGLGDIQSEAEAKAFEWQDVDWVELARTVSPEQYNQYQAQAREDIQRANEIRQHRSRAQAESFNMFVSQESERLKSIAPEHIPDLLIPEKQEKTKTEMLEYVRQWGFTDNDVRDISAVEMAFVYKAMKYDALIARQKQRSALTPKPDARTSAKPIRAGARASSPQRAVAKNVQDRFRKTGDTKLAFELLKNID